jgi:hypothetical protein
LVIYLNVIRAFRKALETVALKENNHDVRWFLLWFFMISRDFRCVRLASYWSDFFSNMAVFPSLLKIMSTLNNKFKLMQVLHDFSVIISPKFSHSHWFLSDLSLTLTRFHHEYIMKYQLISHWHIMILFMYTWIQ